jgi:hypothetical protein
MRQTSASVSIVAMLAAFALYSVSVGIVAMLTALSLPGQGHAQGSAPNLSGTFGATPSRRNARPRHSLFPKPVRRWSSRLRAARWPKPRSRATSPSAPVRRGIRSGS